MNVRNYVSADRLREVVSYNPDTGLFTRLISHIDCYRGQPCGSKSKNGYLLIMVDRVRYPAHRLAWLYVTGEWPRGQIDHIDLDKENNRFSNLRDATLGQNRQNRPAYKNNKLGLKGVTKTTGCNRWSATISDGGKRLHLGCFDSAKKAHEAYAVAAKKFHGEFARAE